jgi:hypothetical protein
VAFLIARVMFVVLAFAVPAFCLATARLALRSAIAHRYWWAFISLLASPVMTLGWDSNWFTTRVLTVQLLGVGFQIGAAGTPSWLAVALPSGALLFRQRRRELMRAHRPLLAEDMLPPPGAA